MGKDGDGGPARILQVRWRGGVEGGGSGGVGWKELESGSIGRARRICWWMDVQWEKRDGRDDPTLLA